MVNAVDVVMTVDVLVHAGPPVELVMATVLLEDRAEDIGEAVEEVVSGIVELAGELVRDDEDALVVNIDDAVLEVLVVATNDPPHTFVLVWFAPIPLFK